MGPSNITEVDISGLRQISTGREEQVVYDESSGKGVKIRLRKWNRFGW